MPLRKELETQLQTYESIQRWGYFSHNNERSANRRDNSPSFVDSGTYMNTITLNTVRNA